MRVSSAKIKSPHGPDAGFLSCHYIKNLTLTRRLCGSFPEQNNKNKRKVYYLETDK